MQVKRMESKEKEFQDYEKNSDGYALFVEKRPSLTPLTVNMTIKDLKDW